MFTIKFCHDFIEDLYHSVSSVTGNLNHASPGYGVDCVSVDRVHFILGQDENRTGQAQKGERGVVFVMNENGKTVARYDV